METFEPVWTIYLVLEVVGLLLLVVGYLIPKRHWYWLIAGLNGLTQEELSRYNLPYIERLVGRALMIMGALVLINPPVCLWLGLGDWVFGNYMFIILGSVFALFLYIAFHRKNIYQS